MSTEELKAKLALYGADRSHHETHEGLPGGWVTEGHRGYSVRLCIRCGGPFITAIEGSGIQLCGGLGCWA